MSYDENLRQWDLKTGRLKATWETTPGYVGANGKFFLKEAGPPGHLELWKIGPPNKKLQTFEYRSPTCGPSILDAATADDGIDTFEVTWMGNGFTKDGYMLGLSGWVARDCTEILRTNAYFNSAERAQEELQYDIQRANRIIRPEAAAGSVKNVLPGDKAVLVFVDAKSHLETMAVVWTDGNTYCKTSTLSLPVALRLADNTQSDSSKR